MAMTVSGPGTAERPLSDINTTPLVDVMLVLLIIFLIAVPVVLQTVDLKLPKVRYEVTETGPENVNLSITTLGDGRCGVYWNTSQVGYKELEERAVVKLKAEIERQGGVGNPELELPEAHIRGDVNVPWQCVGGAIYTMQRAGFAKVGFISEPPPGEGIKRQ